jgi:hypothetical protein
METESEIFKNLKSKMVIKRVEIHTEMLFNDFNIKSRKNEVMIPRQLCIYFLYKHTKFTQDKIGKLFNLHHTSINHSVKVINNYLETNNEITIIFNNISEDISKYNKFKINIINSIKLKLYKVNYIDPKGTKYEIMLICNRLPKDNLIINRINMDNFKRKIMKSKDYKYDLLFKGNYKEYFIESVEELKYINFLN